MFDDHLLNLARLTLDEAQQRRLKIATAESCTGGLILGLLTEIPGSSATVERGFIVYSNKAKEEMLNVPGDLLADAGAVSEPVARAMAEGALAESRANLAIAVTGVAGPDGGTALKPVGLVHIAVARENMAIFHQAMRFGSIGRSQVRRETILAALEMARKMMS
jgi:nicotinamide-nucleotide amidase